MPGCFKRSLQQNPVSCLFNHLDDKLLGRTESRTLQVQEDAKGLRFDVKLPDTTYANDLVVLMERGDAYECSFAFAVPAGGDVWSEMPDGTLLRSISEALLFEGSILVSPAAYPSTSANLRSLPAALRSKLSKRDDDSEFDDDLDCDGVDADDLECEDRDECGCDCAECAEDRCNRCVNERCADERCARDGCPAAGEVETLRLRLKLARHRAKRPLTH